MDKKRRMIKFLVVYKYNIGVNFNNLIYYCEGAPMLSEIQLKIMEKHKWSVNDFAIINIIPLKSEIQDLK